MSAADKVRATAEANGWMVLAVAPSRLTVFRWLPGIVRQEVCFAFDAAGRIDAVSTWENRRISVDQEPGRRKRAEALLASDRASGSREQDQ